MVRACGLVLYLFCCSGSFVVVASMWLGVVYFAFTLSNVSSVFCILFSRMKDICVCAQFVLYWVSQCWTHVIFELFSYTFQY